jgi:hypothetical protein
LIESSLLRPLPRHRFRNGIDCISRGVATIRNSLNVNQAAPLSRLHLSLALISLALGVGLSAAVYIALTAKGGWFENRASIEFSPADIVLVRGKMTQRGPLAVPIADADGVLVFRLSEKLIDTSSYPTLRIAALADTPPIAVRLLWRHSGGSDRTSTMSIDWQGDGLERISLIGNGEWSGKVAGLALAFKLQPNSGLVLQSATLLPDTGRSIVAQLVSEWLEPESWTMHSVNYLFGGVPNPRLPMLPMVVAVAGLALVAYAALARRRGIAPSIAVGVGFAIGAWILVDARWQVNLLSNLRAAKQTYAGKTLDEKHKGAEDGMIYLLAQEIRRALPRETTKITLVSDLTSSELFLGRLRYYLFPLWLNDRPDQLDPRAVLAIVKPAHLVSSLSAETLTLADGRTLAIETLVDVPSFQLLRLR